MQYATKESAYHDTFHKYLQNFCVFDWEREILSDVKHIFLLCNIHLWEFEQYNKDIHQLWESHTFVKSAVGNLKY